MPAVMPAMPMVVASGSIASRSERKLSEPPRKQVGQELAEGRTRCWELRWMKRKEECMR